jgi:hypothetical protein
LPLHCIERQIHPLNVCFVLFFVLGPCPEANNGKCCAIFDCKSYYVQEMWMHLLLLQWSFIYVLVEVMNPTNDGAFIYVLVEVMNPYK